ncbi:MAG: hypothetical protein Q8L37_05545 [Candidatus Gottesmanbacteria bacterium]|nr:hypothetical protein [Candidatus Gottesmanbacteria bacterium]
MRWQTNMWMVDNDADGYPASATITAQTNTPGGTYVRRKTLQTYTATDSNDSDASVHEQSFISFSPIPS